MHMMRTDDIYRELRGILGGYIKKRVRNSADAEDLLQEVFIKIHLNLHLLNNKQSLKSWIFTLTRNTITDHYRKHRHELPSGEDIPEMIGEDSLEKGVELESCIHRFVGQLPDEYREIILDSEIKGIRQKDLVEKYHLAYPSVRSRVQRGRQKLKQMLNDCCALELDTRGNIMEAIPRQGKNLCII
jgi:RNA polymerase sigma-70 factor, ECF subfamily